MKNEIYFYYQLKPAEIQQQHDKIVFYSNNKKYILYKVEQNIGIVEEKYQLHKYLIMTRKFCHKILLNIFGNIITRIRNNQYVLVEISMKNRKIEFYDLIYLMEIKIDATHFIKIKRDNWNKLWGQKVDYIEQRSESLKKQNGIQQETIDFFVGVTENCIALINETYSSAIAYTISHERISPKMTTDEFYNPLKFILDVRVRDVSEYIKKTNETDNKITLIRQLIMCKTISTEELVLLFIRMMFPSEFFDQSDSIISEYNGNGLTKNKDLKPENFFEDIKKLYLYLKDIINLPNIEWLNIKE